MRFASLILALAFVCGGPSLAGSPDGRLPYIGSFAFNDGQVPAAAPTLTLALVR